MTKNGKKDQLKTFFGIENNYIKMVIINTCGLKGGGGSITNPSFSERMGFSNVVSQFMIFDWI